MRILVPIKRVIDANMQVRVKADKTGVENTNVKMAMNPFCEIAIEEAVRLKEAGIATEVVAVTIGTTASEDVLRTAFAMGVDRAVLIASELELEPLNVAKILASVANHEQPGVVIMGKQAIDNDNNQTPQMLSAILGWSQITYASNLDINGTVLSAVREIDGGIEHVQANLPCIVSADLRLNEPRYASLPNIMKAKKRTIESASVEQMGVEIKSHTTVLEVEEPATRNAGIKVKDVAELVSKLKTVEKVM